MTDRHPRDDWQEQYDVDYRATARPTRQSVLVSHKTELPGRRRMANQARYSRGGQARFHNGPHRRRRKRGSL